MGKIDGIEGNIRKRNVIDIINNHSFYLIPSYQRGYRWSNKQVKEFLDDIWDWGESKKKDKYCLQPIVIKENEDKEIDLIDGQQRLTTLYIVLKAIGEKPSYVLNYETRKNSKKFLEEIDSKIDDEKIDNIDFYFFVKTYKYAKKYFEDKGKDSSSKWFNYLTSKENGAFFIEYDATDDERKPEEIFINLNAGKIQLTNSELVKGLFLKKSTFVNDYEYLNKHIEMAIEWDGIERQLQDKDFWAWLGEIPTSKPRIDFILNIVAKKIDEKLANEYESYDVFLNYLTDDDENHNIKNLWLQVKQCFMTIKDWYEDCHIRHYVGFLTLNNNQKAKQKKDLLSNYYFDFEKQNDFSFERKICDEFNEIDIDIDTLDYEKASDKSKITKCLLLFNILTCIDSNIDFDFSRYTKTEYDIEHIYPHSDSEEIKSIKDREKWLHAVSKSDLFEKILSEFKVYDEKKLLDDDELFQTLINRVNISDIKNINGIGNLCLLDSNTNRNYKNMPFPCKVQIVNKVDIENEYKYYILPATKNVFLKYYSGLHINNSKWSKEDAETYKNAIKDRINNYLT